MGVGSNTGRTARVRGLRPDETGLLADYLWEAVFVAPGQAPPPRSAVLGEGPLRAYVEGFGTRAGDLAVCAEADGAVVGSAWCRLMRGYGFVREDVPELAVAVLPAWRGRGVGRALLEALVARCARDGHPGLSLSVQRANPARRLYGRLGFCEVAGDADEAVMLLLFARKA